MELLILLIGLVLVTLGANWLTDGASAVAKRLGVTEFLIGMTIVAVGTSLPEMVVSILASIQGSSDLSAGNIIGSNTCNIFLILGITAVMVPIAITKTNIKIDMPITLGVSIMFAILSLDSYYTNHGNSLSRFDGILFLLMYAVFLWYMIRNSKDVSTETKAVKSGLLKSSILIIVGFVALIGGAKLFVSGATKIAFQLGISEAIIGITIVAIGTSLPELAASFVAAIKGKSAMAIGNILGSNIANILLIMGLSSTIKPLNMVDITVTDFLILNLGPVLLLLFPLVFRSKKITRAEGIIFLIIYFAYTIHLIS